MTSSCLRLRLATAGWLSVPVDVAIGGAARLRGLRGQPSGRGLLLRTRSVHGLGMTRALEVLALDVLGRVIAHRRLSPGGVVFVREAVWMVELPAGHPPPPVGSTLAARPILAE